MKKTVLTFGLIAGAVMSVCMLAALPFQESIGFGEKGMLVGYTSMVLAFLLTYFGVRSYRDNVGGGAIGIGRALAIGLLITAVGSACYVATWQVVYYKLAPDFMQKYQAYALDKARESGATVEAIAAKKTEMDQMAKLYANPLINVAITFFEPLPPGIVIALVTAGVLSRKRRERGEVRGERVEAAGTLGTLQ
jgi:hypothetical protein